MGWRAQRPVWGGWWLDAALLLTFCALTVALVARTPALRLDVGVADWCDAHRPRAGEVAAGLLNLLGQGSPLTLLTVAVAAWRARAVHSIRPLLVPAVAFVLTYFTIGPLKVLTARAAPHYEAARPELLFAVPGEMSYPSGHVVNALVWYAALSIVLSSSLSSRWRWLIRTVPVVIVVGSTTYLSFHWITDDIAAVLLGAVLVRILLRIRWDAIPLGARLGERGWDRAAGLEADDNLGRRGAGPAPA